MRPSFLFPAFAVLLLSLGRAATAGDFYVTPGGADTGPGTADHPFASLARARDAARVVAGSNTVWLAAGDYPLLDTVEFGSADTGLTVRSLPGARVRLSGGRLLTATDFHPVTDPAVLARIAPAIQGKVFQLDLVALGIRHRQVYPEVFNDSGNLVELYFNGRRMPLARFPNEGYMTMKQVLNNAGGATNRNWDSAIWEKVDPNGPGGTFVFRDEFLAQHAAWAKVLDRGVWLKGYWRIPWENEAIRVAAIDVNRRTVTFARPIPGGIGSKYRRPEGSGEEKYWLMNLLEAVDQPGEWAVDFPSGKLYFYPPRPLAGARMAICDNDQPVIRAVGVTNLTIQQITIENNLGHGIEIRGGEHDRVLGCVVRNISRNAIVLDGGFHHEVLSCDLYNLGAGGVWLAGGDEKSSPRRPAGHRVVNNHIHDFAQIERVYAAGVNCGFTGGGGGGHHAAVGMYVAHNLIHDTPHVGILHGSFDSVFEFNEILEYCQVSNDMGAWYCYDQAERMGNQTFRYNYVHDSAEGDGVYFDHDHPEMHVYGNVIALDSRGKRGTGFLYKIGSQGQGKLQSIDCTNNLAINCHYGFEFVTSLPSSIANNVTVNCAQSFSWSWVRDGKLVRTNNAIASGSNISYAGDPGFVDLAHHDYRLRPDSRVFRDLPGFQPIPFDRIGLFVDEYRRRLPTDTEAGRVRSPAKDESLGVEIEDRTY